MWRPTISCALNHQQSYALRLVIFCRSSSGARRRPFASSSCLTRLATARRQPTTTVGRRISAPADAEATRSSKGWYLPAAGTIADHSCSRSFSSSSTEDDAPSSHQDLTATTQTKNKNNSKKQQQQLPDPLALLEKQERQGSLTDAEETLLHALRQHRAHPSAESSSALREACAELQYWEHALRTEQEYEALYCDPNDSDAAAESWYRQGLYWRRLEQFSVATKLWLRALDHWDKQNDSVLPIPQKGHALISLAGIDFARGLYQQAIQRLQQAEPHCDTLGMHVECLQHQGLVYETMEEAESALQKYQQAMELLHSSSSSSSSHDKDEDTESRLLHLQLSMGDLLASMVVGREDDQRWKEARQLYESILERHCTNNNNDDNEALEASLRYKLGKLFMSRQPPVNECYHTALQHLQRAVELERRRSTDSSGGISLELAQSLNVLGAAHAALERTPEARQCFREALLLARALVAGQPHGEQQDPFVVQIMRNLDTLAAQQRHKGASKNNKSEV